MAAFTFTLTLAHVLLLAVLALSLLLCAVLGDVNTGCLCGSGGEHPALAGCSRSCIGLLSVCIVDIQSAVINDRQSVFAHSGSRSALEEQN